MAVFDSSTVWARVRQWILFCYLEAQLLIQESGLGGASHPSLRLSFNEANMLAALGKQQREKFTIPRNQPNSARVWTSEEALQSRFTSFLYWTHLSWFICSCKRQGGKNLKQMSESISRGNLKRERTVRQEIVRGTLEWLGWIVNWKCGMKLWSSSLECSFLLSRSRRRSYGDRSQKRPCFLPSIPKLWG